MVLSDNQKIGIGLISGGLIFLSLGVMMIFDRSMLAIGNALFLSGLVILIGFTRTLTLFTKKDKIRAVCCFFGGIFLVLVLRWSMIGMILETLGGFGLFIPDRALFPSMLVLARQVPLLGTFLGLPGISYAADMIAGAKEQSQPKNWV